MRLTKKTSEYQIGEFRYPESYDYTRDNNGFSSITNEQIINKLGQLEDIEEELGIDLITLFKALKNGIWTKGGYYTDILEDEPTFVQRPEISICNYYDESDKNYNLIKHEENVWCIYTYDFEITIRKTMLKDYSKTWALTKEELCG